MNRSNSLIRRAGRLAVWLLAALMARWVQAGEPSSLDASFVVPLHRPLLCTRTAKMKGEASGEEEKAVSLSAEETLIFVDEFKRKGPDGEAATRTFLSANATLNGDIDDPPLPGIVLALDKDQEQVKGRLEGPRSISKMRLNELLHTWGSLGLPVDLPRSVTRGVPFEVDLKALVPVMVIFSLPVESATARLELQGMDPATGTMDFRGTAKLVDRASAHEGMLAHCTYDLGCVLKVRPKEGRILSLKLEGAFQSEVGGDLEARIQGTFSSELVTEIGEPVERALKTKPVFRQRPREMDEIGLRITLPSSWDEARPRKDSRGFLSTLHAEHGIAVISVERLEPSKGMQSLDEIEVDYQRHHPDLVASEVTSGIGPGRAYEYSSTDEGKEMKNRAEFYQTGKTFAVLQLYAAAKAFPLVFPDFEKARPTLKALR